MMCNESDSSTPAGIVITASDEEAADEESSDAVDSEDVSFDGTAL
jgi:hypothetical protein